MTQSRKRPIVLCSKYRTLPNNLGFLRSVFCPKCHKLLFAHYDKDLMPNNGWRLDEDWNYCSKCGQYLDLDIYKKLDEPQTDIVDRYSPTL